MTQAKLDYIINKYRNEVEFAHLVDSLRSAIDTTDLTFEDVENAVSLIKHIKGEEDGLNSLDVASTRDKRHTFSLFNK